MGLRSSRAFLQAVKVGSINAHRASDRSLGYGFRWLTVEADSTNDGYGGASWLVRRFYGINKPDGIRVTEAKQTGTPTVILECVNTHLRRKIAKLFRTQRRLNAGDYLNAL